VCKCVCAMAVVSVTLSIVMAITTLLSLTWIGASGVANPLSILGVGAVGGIVAFVLAYLAYSLVCG